MKPDRNVLVVDDDDFARSCLRDALESEGWLLRFASDGVEAISSVRGAAPDLVLLDLLMPQKSGIEVLLELRKGWPQIPVLVISSLDTRSLVAAALDAGAAGFIVKPFHPLEVRDAVSRELGR